MKYTKTPLFELETVKSKAKEVRILVKREDLNHPFISGNKWWKLKYNIDQALSQKEQTLLTFGGAYSNHIYATAAAAAEAGLNSIGIIRGEETLHLNPTLAFAREKGMQLHYISREAYRRKNEKQFIDQLHNQYGNFYLIPEGGTNELAIKGCAELGRMLLLSVDFDYLCLPVGTGGTIAGIACGLNGAKEVIGFSSLKGDSFLEKDIEKHINSFTSKQHANWSITNQYHWGGYAKMDEQLKTFIQQIEDHYSLPLDPVYTSKMLYGVFDLIEKNYFRKQSTILVLHTGGLQGRAGFNLDN